MIFSKFYAECYDQIHSTKSYDGESQRLLEFLEARYSQKSINKVLDFGCGTGIHLNSLKNQNLQLHGYDRNDYMLEIARRKYPNLCVTSNYEKIPDNLDLAYSLFDVVNYQVTDEEVEIFFRALATKLRKGGVVVVDGWHFPGVVQDPPVERVREVFFENTIITRRVSPKTLDNYRTTLLDISLEDKSKSKVITHESHFMRAFDAKELEKIARNCGFGFISFRDGRNWNEDLKLDSWRFVMFAEKE